MSKVRITAIRQTVYSDLMAKYENPIEHTCDIKQGQQWISIDGERPDGLCLAAWTSMCKFVEALAKGRGNFYDGWMRNPMSAMISCNDGFRPYSFYIETIEEQHSVATQDEQKQNMHRAPKDKASLRMQKMVLVIGKNVLPRRQIMADLGMRQNSRHTFINNYLRPALEQQMIVMAYPGTPNKPEQAYRLTAKGLALWSELTLKNSNIQ